jgi:hypothetical protein
MIIDANFRFLRRMEEEQRQREEEEQRQREEEEIRLAEEARRLEEERFQKAVEEADKKRKEEEEKQEAERREVGCSVVESSGNSACNELHFCYHEVLCILLVAVQQEH